MGRWEGLEKDMAEGTHQQEQDEGPGIGTLHDGSR